MIDPDRFAALLCDWCLGIGEDDQVLIRMTPESLPLLHAVHNAVLDRGGWPLVRLQAAVLAEDFYAHAGARHLDGFAPLELAEVQAADALLSITAPANTKALAGVDPALIARAARARSPVQEAILSRRWCGTQWPTPALAQQAGMSERAYADFLEGALFLDRPDPAGAWRALSERQEEIVRTVSAVSELRIEAEGTDLRLRVDGRRWINSDGHKNMPSGEVFTGPHEDSAQGKIRFTVPTGPAGVEVAGVELTFRDGAVVEARAERGQRYLEAALATDPGARLLGELGIGTNTGVTRPTGSILLDEKIAGTVHLALGRSYPETGGRNESALHWDLICDLRDGGRITGDGQTLNPSLWPVG